MVTSYEVVRAVFQRAPEYRQEFEVHDLVPWFRKNIHLSNGLKSDVLREIIKHAEFTTRKSDEVIIKQGDTGECMYVLLRGKVTVYIQYNKSDSDDRQSLIPPSANKSESLRHSLGTFVTHLGPGDQFGEIALIKEGIRSASIITEDPSELIVIHRELYSRSLKFHVEDEFAEKMDFINENPCFQNLAPRFKKQLAMAIQKKKLPYDALLQRQADDANAIYYILRGELKIEMDPDRHRAKFPKLFHRTTPFDQLPSNAKSSSSSSSSSVTIIADEAEKEYGFHRLATKSAYTQTSPENIMHQPNSRCRLQKHRLRPLETCLLGRNENVGEAEILLHLPTYIQTTTSTQKTEVLVLELKHFDRILARRNTRIVEEMISGLELRLSVRTTSRLVERSLPLLLLLRTITEEKVKDIERREAARLMDRMRRKRVGADGNNDRTAEVMINRNAIGHSQVRNMIGMRRKGEEIDANKQQEATPSGIDAATADNVEKTVSGMESRMQAPTDPQMSEEDLEELESKISSFVIGITMETGLHNRSQSPYKSERLRRAVTPVDGLIRPGVTVVFRPKSTTFSDKGGHGRHDVLQKKWRLKYYKLALTSLVPNFEDLPADAKPGR